MKNFWIPTLFSFSRSTTFVSGIFFIWAMVWKLFNYFKNHQFKVLSFHVTTSIFSLRSQLNFYYSCYCGYAYKFQRHWLIQLKVVLNPGQTWFELVINSCELVINCKPWLKWTFAQNQCYRVLNNEQLLCSKFFELSRRHAEMLYYLRGKKLFDWLNLHIFDHAWHQ